MTPVVKSRSIAVLFQKVLSPGRRTTLWVSEEATPPRPDPLTGNWIMKTPTILLACLIAVATLTTPSQAAGPFGWRKSSNTRAAATSTARRFTSTRGSYGTMRRGILGRTSNGSTSSRVATRNSTASSRQQLRAERRERARQNSQDVGLFDGGFYDSNFNGTIDTLESNFGGMPGLWW